MWKVVAGVLIGVVLVWFLNAGSATPIGRMFSVPVHETDRIASRANTSAQTGGQPTPPSVSSVGHWNTQPPQPTSPSQAPPAAGDSSSGFSQTYTVAANNPNGVVVDLPGPGQYKISVTGSYTTGTHTRSVVALLVGAYEARPCTEYSEPCADFWIGNWNAPTPAAEWKSISESQIRLLTVDDLGSYDGNSGAVTVAISN